MSRDEWERAFRDAWTEFYSFEHMRRSLLRQNPHTYWGVLKTLLWYRAGMIEGAHPMVTGFFRLKDAARAPGDVPARRPLGLLQAALRDTAYILREYAKIYLEMQELWLKTRIRRDDYAFLGDLRKLASRSMQEVKLNWARVHAVMGDRLTMTWRTGHQGVTRHHLDRGSAGCHAHDGGRVTSALGTSVGGVRAPSGTSWNHRSRTRAARSRCGLFRSSILWPISG